MRRKDKKIEDPKIIEEILNGSHLCRIAIFDTEYPYIVTMNYGYDKPLIYFHCATQGRKLDLMRKNNKVGFEIVHSHRLVKGPIACEWTTEYRSIVGTGEIKFVTDLEEKKKGLNILMKQHGRENNTFNDKTMKRVLVLKLTITSMSAKQSGDYQY